MGLEFKTDINGNPIPRVPEGESDTAGLLHNSKNLIEVPDDDVGKKLIGWQDFADSNTTESSPIEQTLVNGGEVQLTNNNNDTLTDGTTSANAETTVEGFK